MSEPTNDVLPGSSPAPETPVIPGAHTGLPPQVPPPGSQTPPENAGAAIAEERRLRREAEQRAADAEAALASLQTAPTSFVPDNQFSDEGRAILNRVEGLEETIAMKDLVATYPALKDKLSEFEEFRKEYPRHKLENVAKLFLSERDLLTPAPRIGLENTSGGDRTPAPAGMSLEDVTNLRKNNYPLYKKKLLAGEIDIR